MNRRNALKLAAMGGAGTLVISQIGCGPKVSFYVSVIEGALTQLKPLLPGVTDLINKALTIAHDFDDAWKAGKFATATAIFVNLADVLSQIANDIGVNTPTIKSIVAIAGVALHTIAALLKAEANQPGVVAVTNLATAQQSDQISVVERLGSTEAINAMFAAARP